MHSYIASEIWDELKRYVNTVDREEAADVLVSLLIDHNEDAEDIRDAFKGDTDVKRALASYLDNDNDTDYSEEEEEEDDDYSDDDWDN